MVVELITQADLERARALIETSGLVFEERFDNLVGVYEGRELVATGARQDNILKMFCIDPARQGGELLGELVTELVRIGYGEGYDSFFIFTRPQNAPSFQILNFRQLVAHHQVALLEYGGGLERFLERQHSLVHPGRNGAVVVNCNPFTRGHRYLIEEAASRVDTLYVFVVQEDRSVFPFEVRQRLLREGTADLSNVVVLTSSWYAVSQVTFPAYFLKADESAQELQMEVDLILFGKYLAPFFNIETRFIGTEPYCRTTRLYSETMKRVLLPFGVETVQLERKRRGDEVISAFRVREAIRREAYESLRHLVPPCTLDYILSEEGREIREKLQTHTGRH